MKKISLLLALTFGLMVSAAAQTRQKEYYTLFAHSDSLVKIYLNTVGLSELGESKYADRQIALYKSMFAPKAMVGNDLPALGESADPQLMEVDQYIALVRQSFPNGVNVSLTNTMLDVTDLSKGILRIIIYKALQGTDADGFMLRSTAQEILTINFTVPAIGKYPLKIAGIEVKNVSTAVMNDDDGDMVPNDRDKCPNMAGDPKYNGCLPPKPKFYLSPMLTFSSPSATTSFGNFGSFYPQPSPVVNATEFAGLSFRGAGLGAGLRAEYFFDTQARFGIGAGLGYSSFTYAMSASPFTAKYRRETPADAFSYQQSINTGNLTFDGKMSVLSIPITLAWRIYLDSSLALVIRPGIQVSSMSVKGTTSGNFTYGIGTTYDPSNPETKFYYDPDGPNTDLVIAEGYKGLYTAEKLNTLREQQGYNVGANMQKSTEGSRTLSGFGPTIGIGAEYGPGKTRLSLGLNWAQMKFEGDAAASTPLTDAAAGNDLQPLQDYITSIKASIISLQAGLTFAF